MRNTGELAIEFNVEHRSIIKKYSTELGKLKGGIIKCKLKDFSEFTKHSSILDAVNNEYVLAEQIILEFIDGNDTVVFRDHFYVFAHDFYVLPGIHEALSPRGWIPKPKRERLIEKLGPKAKKKLFKKKIQKQKQLTDEEELLMDQALSLAPNFEGVFKCNIYDYYDFSFTRKLVSSVNGDYCLLRKIVNGFKETGHITLVYNHIYIINKNLYKVSIDKNGDRCLPANIRKEIRIYLTQNS